MAASSCSVPPNHYIHVEDRNTMITRLEVGPLTFTPKVCHNPTHYGCCFH